MMDAFASAYENKNIQIFEKLLYTFTNQKNDYSKTVDEFRFNLIDLELTNIDYYSFTDGYVYITKKSLEIFENLRRGISQSVWSFINFTKSADSELNNQIGFRFENYCEILISHLDYFIKKFDLSDSKMSSFEFVELIFAKHLKNMLEVELYADQLDEKFLSIEI